MKNLSSLDELRAALRRFAAARDWEQFHNPKDLAIALSLEASELLEAFLWKQPHEANIQQIKEELADVLAYALLIAKHYNFNVDDIVMEKIAQNALKYPTDKAKGNATKYTDL